MNRFTFRTAHPEAPNRVTGMIQRCAAAVAVLGFAVSVSASAGSSQPEIAATKTSVTKLKHRWYQIGVASWYGHQFQGRRTAAGERFDMNSMTCAHPSLPMGTWLKVTNLKNRQTAFVRVNDRGPVLEGRIVDLSFAAARALGMKGLGQVKLESIPVGDPDLVKGLMAQVHMPVLYDQSGRSDLHPI